jgi:hypothetical protein
VLPELVNLQLAVGGELQPGRSYTLRTFDALTMQERDVEMRVLAESTMIFPDSAAFDSAAQRWVPARWDTVRAFRVQQATAGLSVDSWIDEQGHLVSTSSPIGFQVERTAFEIAVENFRQARRRGESGLAAQPGDGNDLISTTAIAANVQLQPEDLQVLATPRWRAHSSPSRWCSPTTRGSRRRRGSSRGASAARGAWPSCSPRGCTRTWRRKSR